MANYEAIIIGSGAGGLSAALSLARRGFSVLILEAMPSFGGYLNPFKRKPYTFDTGLHYLPELGKGERFWNLLDALGIAADLDFVELDPDGFDRYVFPDYEVRFCKGKERFRERLIRDFPKEARGINKFFNVLDKILKAVDASMSTGEGTLRMLGFLLKHPVMLKYSRVPYQRLLDEVTSDERLQAVLAANWGTYGLQPARASVIIALAVWGAYLGGAYYPKGGSGTVRDAFLDGLKRLGAEMKSRSRVIRIDKKGENFQVQTESGALFTAKAVVSDADPVITLGELVSPHLVPRKIQDKVKRLRPSIGSLCAFIGTDLDLPSLGITNANIYHHEDFHINRAYENLSASYFQERAPGFLLTSPSVKNPGGGHAPGDRHTVQLVSFVRYDDFEKWSALPSMKRGEKYEEFKEKIGLNLVVAAERYIPGLREHMECVEYATPLSNAYWVNAVRGGCYGPEQTPDQMGPGRFPAFTAGIEGLFLAGAGTMGAGIMPCLASGLESAAKTSDYIRKTGRK